MRAPLTVRINDGRIDRHVTRHVSDLRFRKTAPGGHHSASMNLALPRETFTKLGPEDRIYIYDGRTGATVWDGYTENPGASDSRAGQAFELSALGGSVLASDQSEKLVYLDRTYEGWRRANSSAGSAATEVGAFPATASARAADKEAIYLQFNPGQPVDVSSRASINHQPFQDSPMSLGGVAGFWECGLISADYSIHLRVLPWVLADGYIVSQTAHTTGGAFVAYAGTNFLTDRNTLQWFLLRLNSATNVATDNVWAGLGEIALAGQLLDRYGNTRPMNTAAHLAATNPVTAYILAHEVVEDLLGRMLKKCDPNDAVIDSTTFQIDQLTYFDGATAAQVFDDLALYEPNHHWGIGETLTSGLHRFWYRAWPTDTARYEITAKDGYSAPGGDIDLCNRITVYWTDSKGIKQATVRTRTVEALGTRTRDAEAITLPEGRGSSANAQRIGDRVLAAKADPPKAAVATVRRPLTDHLTGNQVMPWEIEPGYLVRVRETGDLLRLTEVEYVDADCAASLTLGEPVLTEEQRIVRLKKRRR